MNEIIYGTTNPAKVAQVRDVLEPLNFRVKSLMDCAKRVVVDENGQTAGENARKKALAYAKELNSPVLSTDVALYIQGLPDDQQPGLHVRRIKDNKRATDQELIGRYSKLVNHLGGRANAYWRYAFALAWPSGRCTSFVHDSPRILVSQPSEKMVEGFPAASLLLDPESGKYISELSPDEMADFWRKTVGNPLAQFMQENYSGPSPTHPPIHQTPVQLSHGLRPHSLGRRNYRYGSIGHSGRIHDPAAQEQARWGG